MSRIEDALKKLQRKPADSPAPSEALGRTARGQAVPIERKKKVTIEGEKHHVSQEDLVRAGLLAPLDHAGAIADEFRRIKRPLIANSARTVANPALNQNVIMIASGLPNAGKTFCSVNLAFSLSLERELHVLLVDADVAKPHISRAFGLEARPGLIDLLVEEAGDVSSLLVRTDLNDIQILPAGRSHPQATELLASERMSAVVEELSTRYPDRIVILDSPPLLMTSEAQALAGKAGQIVVIVEAGRTSKQSLEQTIEALPRDKAVNIILNKTSNGGRAGDGEYGYGYERR